MASIQKRPNGRWRARYRDAAGKEHARHFDRKVDAQRWLDEVTTSVVTGTYVDPARSKLTVGEWCEEWLRGYAVNKTSTVRQARTHINVILTEFADVPLRAVKPSHIKRWTAALGKEYEPSYVYAVYRAWRS